MFAGALSYLIVRCPNRPVFVAKFDSYWYNNYDVPYLCLHLSTMCTVQVDQGAVRGSYENRTDLDTLFKPIK